MISVPPVRKTASFVAAILIILSLLLLTRSAAGSAVNLTQNWGFEGSFTNGVGQGWSASLLSGSATFASSYAYFYPGWVERTEGATSQLIISQNKFDAVVYQRVSGVTVGAPYAAKAAMLTIFQSSAPPAYPDKMQKLVGIDPYGGTNANSPNIVWSPIDDHDEGPWVDIRVAAVAKATTITVFVRVNCLDTTSGSNQAFIDAVMLARAPTVSASSPAVAHTADFTVTWNNAQAAPGGDVDKYDVQYKGDVSGIWTPWKNEVSVTSAIFTGVGDRTYTFRARAYEKYTEWFGVRLCGAWSNGDTTTQVIPIGGAEGYVRDNRDIPMLGATVAISGTESSAQSTAGGYYKVVPPDKGTHDVSVSFGKYNAPPETRNVYFDEPVVPLDFTVRPWDDVAVNGDFEEELDGWQTATGSVVSPTVVSEGVRSGGFSLALGEDFTGGGACGITETVYISDTMYMPTLSFWYRTPSQGAEADDLFEVGIYHGDPLLYHPLGTMQPHQEWTHAWFDVSAYTGAASISFTYSVTGSQDVTVYLDEVSLGRMSGGPNKAFLPLICRAYSD